MTSYKLEDFVTVRFVGEDESNEKDFDDSRTRLIDLLVLSLLLTRDHHPQVPDFQELPFVRYFKCDGVVMYGSPTFVLVALPALAAMIEHSRKHLRQLKLIRCHFFGTEAEVTTFIRHVGDMSIMTHLIMLNIKFESSVGSGFLTNTWKELVAEFSAGKYRGLVYLCCARWFSTGERTCDLTFSDDQVATLLKKEKQLRHLTMDLQGSSAISGSKAIVDYLKSNVRGTQLNSIQIGSVVNDVALKIVECLRDNQTLSNCV